MGNFGQIVMRKLPIFEQLAMCIFVISINPHSRGQLGSGRT